MEKHVITTQMDTWSQVAIPAAVFGALGAWLLTTAFDLVETSNGPSCRIVWHLLTQHKPGDDTKLIRSRYHDLSAAAFVFVYTLVAFSIALNTDAPTTLPFWLLCLLLVVACVWVWAGVGWVITQLK